MLQGAGMQEKIQEIGDQGRRLLLSFLRESERAIVVLGVAQIDADLERVLTHVLHPSATQKDDLFSPGRALSSFGSKIALAHRLGLIDNQFRSVLNILRRIRNDFAHNAAEPDLALAGHEQQIMEVVRWAEADVGYQRGISKDVFPENMPMLRRQFIVSIIAIMVILRVGELGLTKVTSGGTLTPALRTEPQ